jgi:hypothetical protein
MTSKQLHGFKKKVPFKPFAIHMTDGQTFSIDDPEDLFIHPDWTVDAIVLHPRGRFSFLDLKNVASVSSEGRWPKIRGRRGKSKGNGES